MWRQFAEVLARRVEAARVAYRGLVAVLRRIVAAVRRLAAPLVRLADQRRVRLRVMHVEYRRRLRHRRRRAR
ncbi:hypothetical protein GA0070610_1794 [Micromonospora echinofusca]|uniref:Uncharacterized protein n=1 Tax=Micromonospora echinofusca TaxID=47858 RepID=A0A1C5G750_MICEH|nr:hypothetical protein [Micromonospora echinofusca]SCG15560.1 hypothetical protein GA0070610_1794 [Micromonospora echinofusca]